MPKGCKIRLNWHPLKTSLIGLRELMRLQCSHICQKVFFAPPYSPSTSNPKTTSCQPGLLLKKSICFQGSKFIHFKSDNFSEWSRCRKAQNCFPCKNEGKNHLSLFIPLIWNRHHKTQKFENSFSCFLFLFYLILHFIAMSKNTTEQF